MQSLDTAAEASGAPGDSGAVQELRKGLLDDQENQPLAKPWACAQGNQGRTPRSTRRPALGPAVRLPAASFAAAEDAEESAAESECTPPPPSYARRTASSASRVERTDQQARSPSRLLLHSVSSDASFFEIAAQSNPHIYVAGAASHSALDAKDAKRQAQPCEPADGALRRAGCCFCCPGAGGKATAHRPRQPLRSDAGTIRPLNYRVSFMQGA